MKIKKPNKQLCGLSSGFIFNNEWQRQVQECANNDILYNQVEIVPSFFLAIWNLGFVTNGEIEYQTLVCGGFFVPIWEVFKHSECEMCKMELQF